MSFTIVLCREPRLRAGMLTSAFTLVRASKQLSVADFRKFYIDHLLLLKSSIERDCYFERDSVHWGIISTDA